MTHRVGALIFPGFELLDLFGPLEMFGHLPETFAIQVIAETPGPIASGQGPSCLAEVGIDDAAPIDILLIPGGYGTRREVKNQRLLHWIATAVDQATTVATVCTGSALLARTGCLDGRKATTNKLAFDWVVTQGPSVNWQRRARWVKDGKYFTSSGVSAGIDMSLALIAHLCGDTAARQVANWSEYSWNDNADDDPFAAPDSHTPGKAVE